MKTIHRYELKTQDAQEVETHAGAVFLSVAVKPGDANVSLWALLDTTEPKATRTVRIVGTGHEIVDAPDEPDFGFVGTAFQGVGFAALCWHVFVELEHV